MKRGSSSIGIALVVAMLANGSVSQAQTTTRAIPTTTGELEDQRKRERQIRRDVPMTNSIRRAFAMGTRDSSGRPGRNYWQLRVDYDIDARLDTASKRIIGRETITLHNGSDSALREIKLRLDQNVFSPRAARADDLPESIEITDGMTVTRLRVNGRDVPREAAQKPIVTGLETTVATIQLASPIAPKTSATLEVDWSFRVPGVSEGRGVRMGRMGDSLYQVAQWYPRVAVYDDLQGWNDDRYLGSSEFYNNFGRFDVRIDVPAGWLVGATGVLQNPAQVLTQRTRDRLARVLESDDLRTIVGRTEFGAGVATAAGNRLVWRFVADSVNDFAWATSRSYVWDATRATIPGRGEIPVHLLYLPGDTAAFKPAASVTRHALEFYSNLLMPYPYPVMTLADGPELGMEYPMFLMSAVGAADHEVLHQWWPMAVSNNETWYGWMDEGLNMYAGIYSAAAARGQPPVLDGYGLSYGLVSGDETESPMMWPANHQAGYYGYTTYNKAPPMLSMLGAIVGDTAVIRGLREFTRAWRFRHPSPWDFMFFMNNALNRDLDWFWYYWLFTTDAVHGSIVSASPNIGAGVSGPATVVVRQDGQMPSPVVLRVTFAEGAQPRPMRNSVMLNAHTAIVTWPVDVWFDGSRTFRATLDFGGAAIQRVELDPFRRFPDRNPRDNVWPR